MHSSHPAALPPCLSPVIDDDGSGDGGDEEEEEDKGGVFGRIQDREWPGATSDRRKHI
jgi:hypothetical protein